MKLLEKIALALIALSAAGVIAIASYLAFKGSEKRELQTVSIMSVQTYKVLDSIGREVTECIVGIRMPSNTIFEISIKEVKE